MRILPFAILIVSLGCGGSSSGTGGLAACGDFTPCGGSVVGTWRITEYCSEPATFSSSNCTMKIDLSNVQLSGTFDFTSSGSYSSAGSGGGTATFTYSQGCLTAMKIACAQMASSIESADAGVSLSCISNAAGDCNCTEAMPQTAGSEQGTYTISGSSLVMTKTGSTDAPTPSDYCVQGNTLKMRQTGPTSATSSGGSSIMVLTRQ
jgi:hypothetical protein